MIYLVLKKSDEELEDFLKQTPEELLIRWFNYHLTNANHSKRVANFSGDIKDGENYTILLNQLNSDKCDKSGLSDTNLNDRCRKVIENSS
jgi:plastin-1